MKAFEEQIWSYIVQEQLGDTLEAHLFERDEAFSPSCTYKVGLQLLDQIKCVHETGYTFNDIKLDNIMVGYPKSLIDSKEYQGRINLIDFGLAQKFVDDNGQHIPKSKLTCF